MSQRNLVIITKIILIYSIFYVCLKVFILFKGAWLIPNLVLLLPFLILALIAAIQVKRQQYSWMVAIIGMAVIVLTRIFESRWVVWLHNNI